MAIAGIEPTTAKYKMTVRPKTKIHPCTIRHSYSPATLVDVHFNFKFDHSKGRARTHRLLHSDEPISRWKDAMDALYSRFRCRSSHPIRIESTINQYNCVYNHATALDLACINPLAGSPHYGHSHSVLEIRKSISSTLRVHGFSIDRLALFGIRTPTSRTSPNERFATMVSSYGCRHLSPGGWLFLTQSASPNHDATNIIRE